MTWDAVLFIHQVELLREASLWEIAHTRSAGYYTGAVLKFTVQFPGDYPRRPPAVHFLSDVFHPLIGPQDGLLNLKMRFRPWRYERGRCCPVL
jgi:ubiquitin-protein ligase